MEKVNTGHENNLVSSSATTGIIYLYRPTQKLAQREKIDQFYISEIEANCEQFRRQRSTKLRLGNLLDMKKIYPSFHTFQEFIMIKSWVKVIRVTAQK